MSTLRRFNQDNYSEDQLHRIRRVTIPLRWLMQMYAGHHVDPISQQYVTIQELDLPPNYVVCGAELCGLSMEVLITHPSFEPTPINEPIPEHKAVLRCRSLELALPKITASAECKWEKGVLPVLPLPTPESIEGKPVIMDGKQIGVVRDAEYRKDGSVQGRVELLQKFAEFERGMYRDAMSSARKVAEQVEDVTFGKVTSLVFDPDAPSGCREARPGDPGYKNVTLGVDPAHDTPSYGEAHIDMSGGELFRPTREEFDKAGEKMKEQRKKVRLSDKRSVLKELLPKELQ